MQKNRDVVETLVPIQPQNFREGRPFLESAELVSLFFILSDEIFFLA